MLNYTAKRNDENDERATQGSLQVDAAINNNSGQSQGVWSPHDSPGRAADATSARSAQLLLAHGPEPPVPHDGDARPARPPVKILQLPSLSRPPRPLSQDSRTPHGRDLLHDVVRGGQPDVKDGVVAWHSMAQHSTARETTDSPACYAARYNDATATHTRSDSPSLSRRGIIA